jgi:hypothetical protein
VAIGLLQDIRLLIHRSLIFLMANDRGAKTHGVLRSTEGALAWDIHEPSSSYSSVLSVCGLNIELYLAWNTKAGRVTREGVLQCLPLELHGRHRCASGGCVIDGISEAALAISPVLLIVSEDHSLSVFT